jgi:myosin heavy subunit
MAKAIVILLIVLLQASMKDNDIDDANQFKIVKHAMDVIAISDEEQAAIFNLIASVLHLGNVGFSENDNGIATITGLESLRAVAKVSLVIILVAI